MAALAQCDAFGFIYDQAGDPAADILVVLKRVLDASGNPILLSPKTTVTDSAGSFHFTLPEFATAFISARASALWNCPDGRAFTVPPGPSGELIPDFSIPPSTTVIPPLVYVSDVLSIPRASETQDGYLSAADFVRFEAEASKMVVTQVDTGTGLTGGPIIDTGTISLATIPGVAGTWLNPTSIVVNAQGQIISITSGAPDTVPPVITLGPPTNLLGTSVTINWTTNEPADSQVDYSIDTSYGTSTPPADTIAPVLNHHVSISGLATSQTYHYRVKSTDTAGNPAIPVTGTFTTTAIVDTTAPVISAITAAPTSSGATITWTTDDASDSQVEYGLTISYGTLTTLDSAMVTGHSVLITGTPPLTQYHYRVKSRNAASLLTTSGDNTFTTTAVPDTTAPVISAVSSTPADVTATINWTTNEAADSQVEYGPTTAYENGITSVTNPAPPGVTSHAVTLTGLTASTTYHYRVHSKDAAGNPAIPSADASFTTTAVAPSSLLTELVSYWKFNETTGDRLDTLTLNNLTSYGTLTAVTGKVGNATYCGHGAGWLVAPDSPSLDFTGKSMTIAGWMKIHSIETVYETLISKWAAGSQDFLLWYRDDTHNFEFSVTSNGTSATAVAVDIGGPPTLDTWYFVCAIYDRPNNQIKLSLNNAAFTTATFPGPSIFHSTQTLGVLTALGVLSDVTVDEMGLWGRVLTPTEITQLAAGITHPFS